MDARHVARDLMAALAAMGVLLGGTACGDDDAPGGDTPDGAAPSIDSATPGRDAARETSVDRPSSDASGLDASGPDVPDASAPGPRDALPDPPDAPIADAGDDGLVWRRANLTNYESYPEPGSPECEDFSGCEWAGQFAFVDGMQTLEWVMMHNIVAVHSRDADTYALKTLRLRQDGREIDVTVYDMCSDSDCDGCCTENASETGFLIDIERYTMERFGSGDGIVEFACLDCD